MHTRVQWASGLGVCEAHEISLRDVAKPTGNFNGSQGRNGWVPAIGSLFQIAHRARPDRW